MPRLKLSWILQSGTEHHQSPVQHFAVNRTIWDRATVITLIGSTGEGPPKTAAFLVPAQSHRERACTQVLAACMPWTLRCHEKSTFSSVALYLTQTSHKIQAPFALRKVSCWTLHLAVASRNGFESMKSKVFEDIGVAAWSTRIRSSKAAPAPWHKAHKIYFRKPGSKWNLLCRIQWTELSSALRSAPKFMIKLAPSWPEANRTRRSKSEPGRNQASTNPTQRRSRGNGEAFRLFDGLLLDVLGVSNRTKCMQMEIHWKTFKKKYLETFYTSSESLLLAMRPTWMPWIVTESDFICRKSVLPKYIKLRPALSIWSCKEENSKRLSPNETWKGGQRSCPNAAPNELVEIKQLRSCRSLFNKTY